MNMYIIDSAEHLSVKDLRKVFTQYTLNET